MSEHPKKKVLFLITKSNFGGAQRYVFDLATHLDQNRYAVTVALGGNGALIDKLTQAGIRVIRIPGLQRNISFKKELLSFWQIHTLLQKEQPEVLHVNSSKAGGIGAFIGRLHRIPSIVYTAHGWAFNEDRSLASRLLVGFLHWLTIRLSHHTITVSNALQAQMRWPGTKHKMTTVPLAIDTDYPLIEKAAAEATLATKAGLAPEVLANTLVIGTVAELHPIKRHTDAIEAIATLVPTHPRVHYFIVGDGELHKQLRTLVDNLCLKQHVHFTGAVPDAATLMSAFDIFVLPSRSEAAGYVLLEAGRASLPVVATRVGGIPELITHNVSGQLVAAADLHGLRTALKRYLDSPDLRQAHGSSLRDAVLERSLPDMVAKTIAVYNRV